MNEDEMEMQEESKGKKLFNELCLWLNEIEKGYRIENWENGDGRDLIIKMHHEDNSIEKERSKELKIVFYNSGYIDFQYDDKEVNKNG